MSHIKTVLVFFARLGLLAILALPALVMFGCAREIPKTLLTGRVTLDGSPVANATLEFSPTSGVGAVALARTDAKGNYTAEVSPTRLTVVITALKAAGKIVSPIGPGDRVIDDMRNVLPEIYGLPDKTPLSTEPAEGQTTTADFVLTSTQRTK